MLLGLIDALRDAEAGGEDAWRTKAQLFDYAQAMREVERVPDPMPPGWNRPAPATARDVFRCLLDAAVRVEHGDSFEGLIIWSMPTDEPELTDADFGLVARYRVGNLDGQGGMRVFTPETSS